MCYAIQVFISKIMIMSSLSSKVSLLTCQYPFATDSTRNPSPTKLPTQTILIDNQGAFISLSGRHKLQHHMALQLIALNVVNMRMEMLHGPATKGLLFYAAMW
jgi:hypothetical protein